MKMTFLWILALLAAFLVVTPACDGDGDDDDSSLTDDDDSSPADDDDSAVADDDDTVSQDDDDSASSDDDDSASSDDDDSASSDDDDSASADDDDSADTGALPAVAHMFFQSGFEPDTEHVMATGGTAPCTDDLLGEDLSVASMGHWEDDLQGGPFDLGHFCFGGGTPTQRGVNLVPDPDNPSNQVLHTWIVEPNEDVHDTDAIVCNETLGSGARKARVQHVLRGTAGVSQLNYRVRMRLGQAFQAIVDAPHEITWMTIGEFWNNQPSEPGSFRITMNMVKPDAFSGAPMYFGLKADKQDDGASSWDLVWPEEIVSDLVVPIGEWFTVEVNITEGNASTGRALVHVTTADGVRHEVANVTGWTHSPDGVADGFADINTLKLYTSGDVMCTLNALGHVLEIWWDDYAIGGI